MGWKRHWWASIVPCILFVLSTGYCTVAVNEPPVALDDFLTTLEETPIQVTLMASDHDVDPSAPENHPLTFSILNGPSHGTLSGDLTAVLYELPDLAFVTLTYTPTEGFVGMDTITFSVSDPFDALAIAVVQVDVGQREVLGSLTGRWNTAIAFEGQPFSVSAFSSTLTGFYKVGALDIRADASYADGSFSSLKFKVNTSLGELAIRSTLAFDPVAPAFDYWQTVTSFSFFDLDVTHTFHIPQTPSELYCEFVVKGNAGDLSFTNTTQLNGPCFCFGEEELRVRLPWPDCDLVLETTLSFDAEGFDEFTVLVQDIPLFPTTFFGFGVFVRLETTFTTTSKELIPTVTCKSDWMGCIKLLCEMADNGGTHYLSFYGIKMEMSFPNGIDFHTATSLIEAKNSSVTGLSEYFEVWRVKGPIDACCGSAGRWQIETYFRSDSVLLFDWGLTVLELDAVLSDRVRLSSTFEFRSDSPTWGWEFGLNVAW